VPAPIYVVRYDASWPARFAEERAALARVLSPWLAGPIEHIGSTAVAGCFHVPCAGVVCPAGEICLPSDGQCHMVTTCDTQACPSGTECVLGHAARPHGGPRRLRRRSAVPGLGRCIVHHRANLVVDGGAIFPQVPQLIG
jgi:hypothetical protein